MNVKDGICGLITGDALGVPFEFKSREMLKKNPVKDMAGYGTYNMPPGTWSDDSSLTIATIASIVKKNKIDYDDIALEFQKWYQNGKFTQYKNSFDCGTTTANSIENYMNGTPAIESGGKNERDNGNGSLMRILPLAFIPNIDYKSIEHVSSITHAHERSKIACVFYIETAKSILKNDLTLNEHIRKGYDKIKKYYAPSEELKHFEGIFDCETDEIKSDGYVINTLKSVIYSLKNTDSYKQAVLTAVNLGGDTDTNAAICGGLAGIYYGFDEIPVEWINKIPHINKVIKLCKNYEVVINEHF